VQLINETLFHHNSETLSELNPIIHTCREQLEGIDDALEKAEQLLDIIFVEFLLLDEGKHKWSLKSFQLPHSIQYLHIAPSLKLILLQHIVREVGLTADIVFVPNKLMLRIICNDEYAIIIDVTTGEALNWFDLDQRIHEQEGDPSQLMLQTLDDNLLILNYLFSLKAVLLEEKLFDKVLVCVDMIIALAAESADKLGHSRFILNQLNRVIAFDDWQHFLAVGINSVSATILKRQLDELYRVETKPH
jgi:regulator of sirC expression with transglutaminase-like and TPR domain